MKHLVLWSLLAASAALFAMPAAAQTRPATPSVASASAAQPIPPEDPAVTKRAMEWFQAFQSGSIDRTQLTDQVNAKLTPSMLASMKKQLIPLGVPTGIAYGGARDVKGDTVYRYVVVFPVGALQEYLSVDKVSHKISGVIFLPVR